jgi:hypothetical protein
LCVSVSVSNSPFFFSTHSASERDVRSIGCVSESWFD